MTIGTMRILITCALLLVACEQPIPKCVPGATVACPCPGGAAGHQDCAPAGVFSACECAAPEPDAAVGGFWCTVAGCWPDMALCTRAAIDHEQRSLSGEREACGWQRAAHCYPHPWGLKCFRDERQCESFRTNAAFRFAKNPTAEAAEFFDMTPQEREPMGPCRALEYAW